MFCKLVYYLMFFHNGKVCLLYNIYKYVYVCVVNFIFLNTYFALT